MAEGIPYGVATSLINTLASLAFKEIASIYGVKSEIEWLKKMVEGIKDVLADADDKEQTQQRIRLWIRNLKKVLYEADDLLDEIQTQHLLHKRDAKGKVTGKVREFFSTSNPVAFRYKIAGKIREIQEQFNAVAKTMSKLNLDPRVVIEIKHERSSDWRETSSKHEKNTVGREKSEEEVIDLLLNTDNKNERVSLVAIVGIGGLGKTALAQLVYNNAKANRHFDKQMWVCVSEEFDVKVIVKKILESSIGNDVNNQQLDLLQNKLEQNLNGQRYLLVLDDVWNEDGEKWLQLKKYLMCGAKGSKILVTTRSQTVANIMGVKTPYLLKGLNNDQSWTLLKRLAFDHDQIITQNLESIGQKIALKCAGVPLAIRVMGTLLRSKSRESEWEAILEGDFWKLCEGNNSIMPILKLSYDSLAIELKQCFAYCSLYPKDHLYEKNELIYLWMAQGFLGSEDEKQCPEDVGEDYVHILLMKSFLQDVETDELGEIEYFKMHDLMHDLSATIASSNYCMYVEGRKNVVSCPIHASFKTCNPNSSRNILDLSKLRTFLVMESACKSNPTALLARKRLRSLDLSGNNEIEDLPKSIGKMSHLRYINLSSCCILNRLPRSIGNLVNLQTLILDSVGLEKFSGGYMITKLINLRRLDIRDCKAFMDGMPVGLGRMTSLQRLSHFVVGNDDKKRKKAKLSELKELNLRGSLTIEKLGLLRDVEEESKEVNLRAKKKLVSLTLDWGSNPKMKNSDAMQLLKNLQPHKNLKALKIENYPGVCLSDWLLSQGNLVDLWFTNIKNCQYLVALEGLVSLKTLRIEFMDKLEYIYYKGSSSSSTNFFPSLEQLQILNCWSLRGWLREANVQNERDNDEWHHSLPQFSRLSLLKITCCPNLSCMPTFPSLVSELTLYNASTKPLLDTLNMSGKVEPSTSHDVVASLSKLESLSIEEIGLEVLPDEWTQNLFGLKQLVQLSFYCIKNCQYLGALEGLVSLKTLNIFSMNKLEYIYYKGSSKPNNFFPSLEQLQIMHCRSLRGWLREANVQNERDNDEWHHSLPPFSRLSSLKIDDCPNLSCMPTFPYLVSELTLNDASTKPLLDTLNVSNIVEPSTSHDVVASLSMLKALSIKGIDLEALPDEWMQNLSSLTYLYIWIGSSPEKPFRQMQNLSATLEELTIYNLDADYNIKCQDLCCLHSLQQITFSSCQHLVALPEWICDLQSLRCIIIWDCELLESFPQGMRRLTNLQTLQMDLVPRLKERCEEEIGAEWPKIAYIPNILVESWSYMI